MLQYASYGQMTIINFLYYLFLTDEITHIFLIVCILLIYLFTL